MSEGTKVQGTEGQSKTGYHNLLIWQKSKELVLLVYQITEEFPKAELYGLTSQIRRAAVSVILNVVEGDRRQSRKEFLHFLDIADGSLVELEACFELANSLEYLSDDEFSRVESKRREVAAMLFSFIKSVKSRL